MTLEQLLAKLQEKQAAVEAMKTKAFGADASAADVDVFEKALEDLEALNKQVALAKRAEAELAKIAKPANAPVAEPEVRTPARAKSADGIAKVGLLAMSILATKRGNYTSPIDCLTKEGYGQVADEFQAYTVRKRGDVNAWTKALNASTAVAGGILIPEDMQNEIIEFLRPQVAFLAGMPRTIAMPNGSISMPGGATGANAQYGTELSNAAVTEPTFRDVEMSAKELKALIPVSNQFLDFSIAGARAFVEADLRDAMSEKMDNAAWLGTGVAGNPLGLYNIPGIGTRAATNSTTPTIAQVEADLRKCINGMVNLNKGSAKWVMSEVTFGYLQDLRDGNGNPAFPTLQADSPTLKTYPVLVTTNIPTNLGSGNETFLALVAFNHVLFGEASAMEMGASTEASYYDAGGTIRSSFQRGETLLLALMRHDFNVRHLRAVQTLTAVKWGN